MLKLFCAPLDGKNGSAAAYSLLEEMFRALHGCGLPEIKKTPNGKPFFPERPDVFFSLSHSATHVLCAISSEPVGVDIESPRQISERATRYFRSPSEALLFEPLDLWVLKESYIKLVGGTLSMVKSLRFSRENDRIITPDRFAVSRLYSVSGCTAAATTSGNYLPDDILLSTFHS